jgi:hypothetical protein
MMKNRTRNKKQSNVNLSNRQKNWLFGLVIVGGVIIAGSIGIYFSVFYNITPEGDDGSFQVIVLDRIGDFQIPNSNVNWTLHGAENYNQVGTFTEIATGNSLSEISDVNFTDPDNDYPYYIMVLDASLEENDVAELDGEGIGTRTYQQKQHLLNLYSTNYILMNQIPSFVSSFVEDDDGLQISNVSAGLNSTFNFTINLRSNSSEPDAGYYYAEDYFATIDDAPLFVIEYNDTASAKSLNIEGTVVTKINDTAYMYEFYSITSNWADFDCIWDDDLASDLSITDLDVWLGEEKKLLDVL